MCGLSWREPEEFDGPFFAKVEFAGPFKIESETYDIRKQVRITTLKNCLKVICVLAAFGAVLFGIFSFRKKWPFLTVLLYGMLVTVVFMPFVCFVGVCLGQPDSTEFDEIFEFYAWCYSEAYALWIFCGVLIICQLCLLIIPIRVSRERPKPQRGVWFTAIAAAVLMTLLVMGILLSLAMAVWGEEGPDISGWIVLGVMGLNWIVWVIVFRLFARNTEPLSFIRRIVKWLIRGSILELLVAVPSHIIVRQKDVCCAHFVTAMGIAAGLAIMLLSFGPGIYFLYVDRIKSKQPKFGLEADKEAAGGDIQESS